jgi:hypothetical protein
MCVNCDSGDDSSTIPVFPVNIRLQVTPFLQTGFVAHHQPKWVALFSLVLCLSFLCVGYRNGGYSVLTVAL